MNCKCKMAVAFLLILVMLVPLSVGCGGGGGGGKVTITIGMLTDVTGPGAPAVTTITYATQDVAKYYNDENLIPGVKLKIAVYDTQSNPSRLLPGYDWCKNQGAKVIITVMPGDPAVLKPFAERDKVVIAAMSSLEETLDPPGRVFCFGVIDAWITKALLQWVSENDWKGQGIPKLGMASWDEAGSVALGKAIKEYVQKYPGEFDYLGGYLAPFGTMTFTSEAQKFRDCDYVLSSSLVEGYLLRDLRAIGSKAKMLDGMGGAMACYKKLYVDLVGWEALDGSLTAHTGWEWNESSPMVDLAKRLLDQYRASQAAEIIDAGLGYLGALTPVAAIFEVLAQAIREVTAQNFDGQAYFDAAIDYKTTSPIWEGMPQWGFSQTKRILTDDCRIFEFEASEQDVVRITDWLPQIK